MLIEGKVALITGGAGGVGKAFATALLKAKIAAVCLVDCSKNGGEIASQLNQEFPASEVVFYQCDITNYDLFKGAFEFVKTKFGALDIVSNNAGISAFDYEFEKSVKVLRVNLEGTFYGIRLGLEYMDKSKARGGVIVNTASVQAFVTNPTTVCYGASKAGVISLTQSAGMPSSYKRHGVRVNAICPSAVETPMLDEYPDMRKGLASLPNDRGAVLPVESVADGFKRLIEDDELCGVAMVITPWTGIRFVRNESTYVTFEV